ncbi:helix-turn-helix transcriptional regulator [Variovorax saccharolyticus]|uniref:helix-turn-helix transcriptional regulator n=1 Tax=Variovorax saccharolyticus TaxID=3053516 RepID=UPI002575D8B8|nr:helix-turn-helix transcriptional regulator [Variovorax sp. J31P216]MDM0025299.1 helix-turn-helix transcriptional regulator [Variovorax sp. J31P216]
MPRPDFPAPSAHSLVRAIHAASLNTSAWPEVLEQLRRHLDARVVTLGHHAFTTGSESTMFEASDTGSFSQDMAVFSAHNPWFLSSDDYVPGRVMSGEELIDHDALRRTDFYRRFLKPRGLLHLLCGVVDQRARGAHCVSIYRAEDQDAFDAQKKAELGLLLDHITLSLQSQWRWQEADDLAQALLSVSDHDTRPTLLVTADAEPVYRNRAASRLLDQGHGLCMDGLRLVSASPADRRLLQQTIERLARVDPADASAAPSVLTLAGPPGLPAVVVVVRAAGQVFARQAGARQGLVVVAVRGGNVSHDPARCEFARQYELTAAQAKVSALVFAGQSLATVSRTLNLSENTVRSHLKQIFQKTDTHGQMELVHLHARVCTALP